MRIVNNAIAICLWIIGITMICSQSHPVWGVLFFIPFALGPQAVTHVGILYAKSQTTQMVLLWTLLSYFVWFVFVYTKAFCDHPDTQSCLLLLFVGVYAAPVLVILWLAAFLIEKKHRSKLSRA